MKPTADEVREAVRQLRESNERLWAGRRVSHVVDDDGIACFIGDDGEVVGWASWDSVEKLTGRRREELVG